jgi:hypothetical protein
MTQEVLDKARQILSVIDGERFHKFYEGQFLEYLEACDNAPTKEEILAKIASIFRLEDK